MSTPAAEPTVIERIFIAVIEGDPEKVLELVHPQVEWLPTVWSREEEVYRGHDGVRRWLDQFGPGLEHLDIRVERVRTREDGGAVLGTVFDSRDEGMFAVRVAWSFELEDGLMRRGRAHEAWEEAEREAGLSGSLEGSHREQHGD